MCFGGGGYVHLPRIISMSHKWHLTVKQLITVVVDHTRGMERLALIVDSVFMTFRTMERPSEHTKERNTMSSSIRWFWWVLVRRHPTGVLEFRMHKHRVWIGWMGRFICMLALRYVHVSLIIMHHRWTDTIRQYTVLYQRAELPLRCLLKYSNSLRVA